LKSKKTNATIIGTTTWGITLGRHAVNKGAIVKIWARTEAEARELNKEQNPIQLSFTNSIEEAVAGADFLIWAVPSHSFRQNVQRIKDYIAPSTILVSATKGLEVDTGKRMSEILMEEVAPPLGRRVCVLSGPNLSKEIAQGLPAFSIVASDDREVARKAQGLLNSPDFNIFISRDVIGVELGGAFKNIIALGSGMIDGLSLGNNAKAAFITLGWTEAISLAVALGAKRGTLLGLAGLGDLIATCVSPLSRNYHVGYELAKGRSLADIRSSTHQVAEGVNAAIAARYLAQKVGVKTPIINLIGEVLSGILPPSEVFSRLGKSENFNPTPKSLATFWGPR